MTLMGCATRAPSLHCDAGRSKKGADRSNFAFERSSEELRSLWLRPS
jgi:hypothetical protein